MSSFVSLFSKVLKAIRYVEKHGKNGFRSQEHGIALYFETFIFVFYLHLMLCILDLTNMFSQSLQKKIKT